MRELIKNCMERINKMSVEFIAEIAAALASPKAKRKRIIKRREGEDWPQIQC